MRDDRRHAPALYSRLLGADEIEHCRSFASRASEMIGDASAASPDAPRAPDWAARESLAEVSSHRDALASIRPGDRVWITADPSRHPEAEHGPPCLVVVRDGVPVLRHRLPEWAASGLGSPVVAPGTRLMRADAVAIASDWVRARYSIVPPIAFVQEVTERVMDHLRGPAGESFDEADWGAVAGKWIVTFRYWEAPAEFGMPSGLTVLVDDATGEAEIDPGRSESGPESGGMEPPP